jgi:hypothetical protein
VRVETGIEVPVVALEAYDLEVLEPRADFDAEVASAEAAARGLVRLGELV